MLIGLRSGTGGVDGLLGNGDGALIGEGLLFLSGGGLGSLRGGGDGSLRREGVSTCFPCGTKITSPGLACASENEKSSSILALASPVLPIELALFDDLPTSV